MNDPLSSSWIYDNPVIGREIRVRLRPWKVALGALGVALSLTIALGLASAVQVNEGNALLSFGQMAYIFLCAALVVIVTLHTPFHARMPERARLLQSVPSHW